MIAKACTAQNDVIGDGITTTILIIGELLKQAEIYVSEVNDYEKNYYQNV